MTNSMLIDYDIKKKRLREYMRINDYDSAILRRRDSFSWFSCGGDSKIIRNTEIGVGTFLITMSDVFLISETMNIGFLYDDFLAGTDVQLIPTKWYDPDEMDVALSIVKNARIVSDTYRPGCDYRLHELQMLQYPLTDLEVEISKENCKIIDSMLTDFADYIKPGMTEKQVEAELLYVYAKNGFDCQVILAGSDNRISKYRHPIPSDKKLDKTLLIHSAASRKGIFANITRLISFDAPDDELKKKYDAVCVLEAQTLSMSRPGVCFHAILNERKQLYADLGYPDEYNNHYPGSVTGYFVASGKPVLDNDKIIDNQLFDWFITVTGAKVEELSLSSNDGGILLSAGASWPSKKYSYRENTYDLPAIYIR